MGGILWEQERLYTAAFSGYRPNKPGYPQDEAGQRRLRDELGRAVASATLRGYSTFYCGAAWGFDIVAGEAVAALRRDLPQLRLVCAVPYAGHHSRWPGDWQERYRRLLDLSDEVLEISTTPSRACYHERNRLMVDRASLLICFFDGQPGGTASTVRYAIQRGLEIVNLAENEDLRFSANLL